ncbi:hypothetical protein [Streptomyces sp. NPDC005435]|uniref:hypothetical protein n=1 Tax=Streptomyces sp. NPDC005435 TaxID=3154464 RepID=UPI0034561BFD
MSRSWKSLVPEPLTTLALAALSIALWAAWLGWDQHYDAHPDGSVSGPYEPWQVVGLVLTLLVPVCWAASRRRSRAAIVGVPLGLAIAAFYDWSDDASGLFGVGVLLVLVGSVAATTVVSAVIGSMRHPGRTRTRG